MASRTADPFPQVDLLDQWACTGLLRQAAPWSLGKPRSLLLSKATTKLADKASILNAISPWQNCSQHLPLSQLKDLQSCQQGDQPCLQHHPPCQLRDLRGEEEHLKGQLGTSLLMIKTAGREFARRGESMGKHVGRALLFANTSSIYKCNKYILCITSLINHFSYFAWYFTLRIY